MTIATAVNETITRLLKKPVQGLAIIQAPGAYQALRQKLDQIYNIRKYGSFALAIRVSVTDTEKGAAVVNRPINTVLSSLDKDAIMGKIINANTKAVGRYLLQLSLKHQATLTVGVCMEKKKVEAEMLGGGSLEPMIKLTYLQAIIAEDDKDKTHKIISTINIGIKDITKNKRLSRADSR